MKETIGDKLNAVLTKLELANAILPENIQASISTDQFDLAMLRKDLEKAKGLVRTSIDILKGNQ